MQHNTISNISLEFDTVTNASLAGQIRTEYMKTSILYDRVLRSRITPLNNSDTSFSVDINSPSKHYLTWAFFEPSVMRAGAMRAPHHNFIVITPMIMKFGTGVKLDVFYTMETKMFVTSLLLRHYDVITCILADA